MRVECEWGNPGEAASASPHPVSRDWAFAGAGVGRRLYWSELPAGRPRKRRGEASVRGATSVVIALAASAALEVSGPLSRATLTAAPPSGFRRSPLGMVSPLPTQEWLCSLPSQVIPGARATEHWAMLILEELEVQFLCGVGAIGGVLG